MSQTSNRQPPQAAWRVVLASTLSATWGCVFLACVLGIIYSTIGPETGEPSGWRLGLVIAGCWVAGGALAGCGIGLWRVWRRTPHEGPNAASEGGSERVQGSTSPEPPHGPPPPRWFAHVEAAYRWTGWASGIPFLALVRVAPNLWLGLALGLFGACLVGHWVLERAEAAWSTKLMRARQLEALLLFGAAPALLAGGLWIWLSGEATGGP